jgi:serine/threonine protein kinase
MDFCRYMFAKPQWDPDKPQAFGSDKEVFMGSFKGKPVAICVAKPHGVLRMENEISLLRRIGQHPNIASVLYSQTRGDTYFAVELVEPIGFDLERLSKQYMFAKQSVPAQLTKSLIKQLCSALDLMHSRGIIHRDIKVENVLVTGSYEAKLIDLGCSCEIGTLEERWVWTSQAYLAPEVCQGSQRLGPEVDAWGLGLILHQVYQHRFDLLDASEERVCWCPERPSFEEPMEEVLGEAMKGLLAFDLADRWSTKTCQEAIPAEASTANFHDDWKMASGAETGIQELLRKYIKRTEFTAFAAKVDESSTNLHGKRVADLRVKEDCNAVLLLVDMPHRGTVETPMKDMVIEDGAWLYFGLPPEDNIEVALGRIKKHLFPHMETDTRGRSVSEQAGLIAFSLDFDCFRFPPHIGQKAAIGYSFGSVVSASRLG